MLELQSGTLEHSGERFTGTRSGRDGMRSLVAQDPRNIEELQVGLAGERRESLGERLRRNVCGEPAKFAGFASRRWGT